MQVSSQLAFFNIMYPAVLIQYKFHPSNCRYLHVPQGGEGSSGSGRRGSAPAVFPSALAGRSLAPRRGSEPFLPPQGAYSLNRRGSEPLVTSMSVLQQNFERLTTGIAEEEEFGAVEDVPPRQGITVYSEFSLKLHITFSLYGFNYVVLFR